MWNIGAMRESCTGNNLMEKETVLGWMTDHMCVYTSALPAHDVRQQNI